MQSFVARQPIFDQKENVFAYELLFRQGTENFYSGSDGDHASSDVIINSYLLIGIESITSGKKGFINFTSTLLKSQVATILPKEYLAIEILETVEPDAEIIRICKRLKKAGYLLVLDDFVFASKYMPLIEVADIIKIDFLSTSKEERANIIKRMSFAHIKFLAEKIETREEFEEAANLGYSYFQGYYFSKPVIVAGTDIPEFKLHSLRLLSEISRPEIDFDKIEAVIKQDVSLTYKLFKFINSSFFGFRSKIGSIRQALTLLGVYEIKKWVSLIALRSMGEDKPDELIASSFIRASFSEAVAYRLGLREKAPNAFLMGMFSLLDAFLDRPLADVLKELPLSDEIKRALLGEENQFGYLNRLIISYEKAEWDVFAKYTSKLGLDESEIPDCYIRAVESFNKFMYEEAQEV